MFVSITELILKRYNAKIMPENKYLGIARIVPVDSN
jgi:hypothetical protein